MRMYDIIAAKRDGLALTEEQINFFITEYTAGRVPDYQASALLMAVYLRGMSAAETGALTLAMARSGDSADLSAIPGVKVDKHSTGGVGDKTTLIVCPIAAACGVPIAKMSGRGLGHTGGTVDKLESIPGYRTQLGREEFFRIVQETGISLIGQSGNIAPADKKLYALRDVTATVACLPLIASSIMSKKLAAGSDAILLDVKCGSGAFMKTPEEAAALAEAMVSIGQHTGRKTIALITDMDVPLGSAIGNSLEVQEAVAVLKGSGPADLTQVCLALAEDMLVLGGRGSRESCRAQAKEALSSGAALEKLRAVVQAQGGDPAALEDFSRLPGASLCQPLTSPASGYVEAIQTEQAGTASVLLGAGREKKEDAIDYGAGILLKAKVGDYVEKGQPLALLCANSQHKIDAALPLLAASFRLSPQPPAPHKLILGRVTEEGTCFF